VVGLQCNDLFAICVRFELNEDLELLAEGTATQLLDRPLNICTLHNNFNLILTLALLRPPHSCWSFFVRVAHCCPCLIKFSLFGEMVWYPWSFFGQPRYSTVGGGAINSASGSCVHLLFLLPPAPSHSGIPTFSPQFVDQALSPCHLTG
jgi:hypothetical protein